MRSNFTLGLALSLVTLVGCGERVVFQAQNPATPVTASKVPELSATTQAPATPPAPALARVQAPPPPVTTTTVQNPVHPPAQTATYQPPTGAQNAAAPAAQAPSQARPEAYEPPPMVTSAYNCTRSLPDGRTAVATALVTGNETSFWNSSDCAGFAGTSAAIVQPVLQGNDFNPLNSNVSCTFRANGQVISFTLNYGDPNFAGNWEREVSQLPRCP